MQMPKPYPVEFRWRALSLVRSGKSVADTASELDISKGSLHAWVNQDEIDRGQRPGLTTKEHAELACARRRIRELEMEIDIIRRASEIFKELNPRPKESSR